MRPGGFGLRLELQHEPVRPAAATRAHLYQIASECLLFPPTWPRLRDWSLRLRNRRSYSELLAAPVNLVDRALTVALASEASHQALWGEFERLLSGEDRLELGLFASDYAEAGFPDGLEPEQCPKEPGKSCPFADWYCVDRQGSPCDHIAEALKLAARLWDDLASAQNGVVYRRALARCRAFNQRHLSRWTFSAADALFLQARTGFYQGQGLLVGALIGTEMGVNRR